MPIFSSLLLMAGGLTLIVILLTQRPSKRARKQLLWIGDKMRMAANVCEAVTRQTFGIELHYTDDEADTIDDLIERVSNDGKVLVDSTVQNSTFVLSAYLGELLVRNHGGQWKDESQRHPFPFVYFRYADLAASPFDLIHKKMEEGPNFNLKESYARLLMDLEMRRNLRSTTFHPPTSDAVSFGATNEQEASAHISQRLENGGVQREQE